MWENIKKEIWDCMPFLKQTFICLLCLGLGIGVGNIDDTVPAMSNAVDTAGTDEALIRNWGIRFDKDGEKPRADIDEEVLAEYNAHYMADTEEKKIYLTFDCGFENGYTEAILDALKKHNVSATFFVVGHYLESAPELVKRMAEEGHTVANHTYNHPDMSSITTREAFEEELNLVNTAYKELTGQDMVKYYRAPQGKYNLNNLAMAKELGYDTFFWSLAYVDWNQDKQPDPQESIDKLCSRIHPGAIVLLHNTSATNGEIMDDLLTKWEEMGYTFGTLNELCQKP